MNPRVFVLFAIATGCGAMCLGCGTGPTWRAKVHTRTAPRDPLAEAREMLTRFVNGHPVGDDDALLVPDIVAALRKVDTQKADVFEQGFEQLRKTPGDPAAAATLLLQKL